MDSSYTVVVEELELNVYMDESRFPTFATDQSSSSLDQPDQPNFYAGLRGNVNQKAMLFYVTLA